MSGTPKFKVITADGRYIAATVYAEDAAAIVALYGVGAKIKLFGRIVWREGIDGIAAESYDAVSAHIQEVAS